MPSLNQLLPTAGRQVLVDRPAICRAAVLRDPSTIADESLLQHVLQPVLVLSGRSSDFRYAQRIASMLQQGQLVDLVGKGKQRETAAGLAVYEFLMECNQTAGNLLPTKKLPLLTRLAGGIRAWRGLRKSQAVELPSETQSIGGSAARHVDFSSATTTMAGLQLNASGHEKDAHSRPFMSEVSAHCSPINGQSDSGHPSSSCAAAHPQQSGERSPEKASMLRRPVSFSIQVPDKDECVVSPAAQEPQPMASSEWDSFTPSQATTSSRRARVKQRPPSPSTPTWRAAT